VHVDVGVSGQNSTAQALRHHKHAVGVVPSVDLGKNASGASKSVAASMNMGSGHTQKIKN
jgi:hypothetical protein